MTDKLSLTFEDYDGSPQTTSFDIQSLADAVDFATWTTEVNALASALDLWSIGRARSQERTIVDVDNGKGSASSPVAQKSTQLIIEVEDSSTGVIYKERLPMPDLTKASDGDGDAAWIKTGQGANSLTIMNPEHADFAVLKTAYDAIGESQGGSDRILRRCYVEN
jgi:hypothetical protein